MKQRLLACIAGASAALLIITITAGALPRILYSMLLPVFAVSSLFFVIMLAYSAWRLSLISHGFKRVAVAASGGFGAFIAYLSAMDEPFKRSRIILTPLAAALFITALIAAFFIRLNRSRGRRSRRRGTR